MLKLHITDVAFWLESSAIAYIAYLIAYTVWKRQRPKHAEWWMKKIANLRQKSKIDKMRGWARTNEIFIAMIFGALVLLTLVWVGYQNRFPVTSEHNIIVYRQLEDGDWAMSSDEEGPFTYRPCRGKGEYDADAMFKQSVGYIADHAMWEEKPGCRSIARSGFEFWWRDKNFNYRRIDNARASR